MAEDPLACARRGDPLPDVVTLPARLGRPIKSGILATALLFIGSLTLALYSGAGEAWFSVAVAVAMAVAISVLLLGRGPLVLSRDGLSVRALGRRRIYAWQHIAGFRPAVVGGHAEMVAIDLPSGTQPREVLMEPYGHQPLELCELLSAYRAQTLARDRGV